MTLTQASLSESTSHSVDWVDVCALAELTPGTGAAALVAGEQVAVVRPSAAPEVFALSNFDPFSKAFVLARGIVGDKGGVLKIASPIYKQSFDLRTGCCLDDPSVRIAVYRTCVHQGRVYVAAQPLDVLPELLEPLP